MIDLAALQSGYQFPPASLHLDPRTVAAYVAAVEDTSPLYIGDAAVVPPLAVLSLVMRGVTDLLSRRPGALHLSQRLSAHRPIPVGSTVVAHLWVAGRSERRGFAALTLGVRIEAGSDTCLDGSLLLFVPLHTEEGARA
jgi:acyl dehydratase